MKPASHIAASALISASFYLATKSPVIAGVSFVTGFLIDIDHIVDYVREYGFRTDIKEFFRIFHETRFRKLILIFHAWEWVPGLLFFAWISGWNEVLLGLLIGMFQHLLFDQFVNGFTAGGYSILYRAAKRFTMEDIVKRSVVAKKRNHLQL